MPGKKTDPKAERPAKATPFLTDVRTLRERASQNIEKGAVTPGCNAEDDLATLLQELGAT